MPKATESTTKFKADISQLKAAMQDAARQVRLANSEFKAATAGMDNWARSADGLSAKTKQLQSVLAAQNRQLEILEKEYALTAKEQGEDSKAAENLAIRINNQRAAIARTEKDLNNYDQELSDCKNATGSFANETEDATKKTKKASDGFTVMKGVLANLVASGIKAAITGLKQLGDAAVEAYREFDEGADAVIKATGATGKAADKLRSNYKNVAQSVRGDLGDIGSALGEINTRFEFTGKKLETATEDFMKFAKITDTDAKTAVQLVSRAMGDASIPANKYKDVLDELAVAAQKSGISVDTLAEMLTKYGAPMRNLGFDTKQSIALFSAWEKAGVNTAIAFSGMRKAISNWGKSGKDASKEFKKSLDLIKKAPSDAKATTKAIEIFGAKAGPDLADAIRQGRFEYADFTKALKNSKGTVKDTYKETEDGFDKMQLAIQNAKVQIGSAIAKIFDQYGPQIEAGVATVTQVIQNGITWVITHLPQIQKAIETVVSGAKSAIGWIVNNGRTVISVITGIVAAMAVGKVLTFVSSIANLKQAFSGLFKGISSGASMAAGGVGIILTVITSLYAAIMDAADAERELTDAEREMVDEANRMYESSKKAASARADSVKASNTEYNHIQTLKKQYNALIGANGKVKKGYEKRANYILNELAKAMGVERSEIDKTIGKNGKLGASIDKLIEKKRAQALLDANQGAYTEAKQDQMNAVKNLAATTEAYEKQKKVVESWRNELKMGNPQAVENFRAAKEKLDELEAAYKKNKEAVAENTKTVSAWENLQNAVASGSSQKMKAAIVDFSNGLVTASVGTKKQLQQQATDAKKSYDEIRRQYKAGAEGVTSEMVKNAKTMVTRSNEELAKFDMNKAVSKAEKAGVKIPDAIWKGIQSGKTKPADAIKQINGLMDYQTAVKKAKKAGVKIPKEIEEGVTSGRMKPSDAVKRVNELVNKKLEAKATRKKAEDAGTKIPEKFKVGIDEHKKAATGATGDMASSALSELKSQGGNAKQVGVDFSQGYANGIQSDSVLGVVAQAGAAVAAMAIKAVQKKQDSHSPSKVTYALGRDFTKGYINGIGSMASSLVKTAQNLVAGAVGAMLGVNGFEFSKAGEKASSLFSESFGSNLSYMLDKISYQNDQKIAGLDSLIEGLESKRDSEVERVEKLRDAEVSRLEKQRDKTVTALEKERDTEISRLEKERDREIAALEKKRNKAKTKKAKDAIAEQIKETRADYNAQIKLEKKNYNDRIKQTKKRASDELKKQKSLFGAQIDAIKTQANAEIELEKEKKEAYEKASAKMLSEFQGAMSDYQSAAQKLIDDTINGITETYNKRYDELIAKQDNLVSKMESLTGILDVSTAGVGTMKDLKEQTRQIREYAERLRKVKGMVPEDLFAAISQMDPKEANYAMDQILSYSEAELAEYLRDWREQKDAIDEIKEDIFEEDFEQVSEDYTKDVEDAFATLPDKLAELGADSLKGFVDGFLKNTDYMEDGVQTFVKSMVDQFKSALGIASPSKVLRTIGEYTGDGFAVGLKSMIGKVTGVVDSMAHAVATPLDGMTVGVGSAKSAMANGAGGVTNVSTVTNNYSLVQNNTSPKSLSALETYQARRQQIAMVKALT